MSSLNIENSNSIDYFQLNFYILLSVKFVGFGQFTLNYNIANLDKAHLAFNIFEFSNLICVYFIKFSIFVIELKNLKQRKILRVQTVHFVHCKQIAQQKKIRCDAESATLLLFFDILPCFEFLKLIPKTLNRSKLLKKQVILRNPKPYLRNPDQFVEPKNKY